MVVRILAGMVCVVSIALTVQATVSAAEAIPPGQPRFPKKYDALDAIRDAQQYAERQRRAAIDAQLRAIRNVQEYSAAVRASAGRYPYGVDYRYAYPGRRAARRAYQRAYGYPGVFEPWPLVPGDIYGYPYTPRVEQPLGHKVIETGPNGYIYRPVHESDLAKPKDNPQPTLAPPVPEAPRPAFKPPSPGEPIPAPPAQAGKVEF